MRASNAIKNSVTSFISSITSMLIRFVSQAIFIRILGVEYLGLNGLFSNILTILSFFELGIGSAIVFNLYKPIADNNKEEIKSLMEFYKKSYNKISILILILGLLIIPFLKFLVGEITVEINLYLIYILFLMDTISSYIIAYKRSIIYANQKNYIINIIHIVFLLILNICQILILIFTQNYYLYLIIKILCQLLENIIITMYANKLYPYVKEHKGEKLNKDIENDIFKKIKSLIFHKVGGVIINGTDNIIISTYLGLGVVGIYSNYYMIINSLDSLFTQIISSTAASVGDLLVTSSKEKIYSVFKKMRFLNFWISTFSSICILIIIQPFIVVWVGKEYQLNWAILIILVFNYFQKMQRCTYSTFKDAAGIWEEDKFVPLIESALNIVFSIICLKIFGLSGVFMGTIISSLSLWCYSYPKLVYKKLFNRGYMNYVKETVGYTLLFIIIGYVTYTVSEGFIVDNIWLQLVINVMISLMIPNLILFILFRKTENFKYFKVLLVKAINKIIKKDKFIESRSNC